VTTGPGPRPLLKPAAPVRPWQGVAIALFAVGLGFAATMAAVDALRERQAADDFAQIRAANDIAVSLAASHLWMEQWLGGDSSRQEEIWRALNRSLALARAMVGGNAVVEGPWRVRPAADPALRAAAARLQGALRTFAAATMRLQDGLERGERTAPPFVADAEYDRQFSASLETASEVRGLAERRLAAHFDRYRLTARAVLIGWCLVATLAFFALRRFESRRRRAEVALRDREVQLVQSQKMEAVGRLAGGMAHDINNYLAAIRAQCELLLRKPAPAARVAEKAAAIIAAVDRSSSMIARLLTFSRRQPVQPVPVNLNRAVEGLRSMLGQHLGGNIRLDLRLAAGLWNVEMDPGQVEQLVVNLLVNAREAMPTGGWIRVGTRNLTLGETAVPRPVGQAGEYVMLEVADSGPGIPPEIREKIFEPFFTTREDRGNSGLGLATVYSIVKQSRGNVWLESEPGAGAVFRVYLPRCTAALPDTGAARAAAPAPPGGSERILLVEDNTAVREATQAMLEASGYRVQAVAGGEAGLAAVVAGPGFDLVVTDVVMPGMSGPDLVARLRARHGPLPSLFISGWSESVVVRHGALGAQLLHKPFSEAALLQAVRAALGATATAAPAASAAPAVPAASAVPAAPAASIAPTGARGPV
jgi:signal transduction histidine kinase/ActR/RegA family two-component response regulator